MCNNLSTRFIELSDPHFHEPNQKSFKLLYCAFTRNLEVCYKMHRKVLAELDEPIRFKLKKQEQTFLDGHIKRVYQENAHKLIRQNLQRNSKVQSIMKTYHLQYSQHKGQQSKPTQPQQLIFQHISNTNLHPAPTYQKSRSKTFANHSQPQPRPKKSNFQNKNHPQKITDINLSPFNQQSQKKILFYKKNYTHLKNRQRNYSFHSETIDNSYERIENMSSCRFEQQNTSRDHTQNAPKQHYQRAQRNRLNETFRPFCGLNTKDIFVKKPVYKIDYAQQNNSGLSEYRINYVSRAMIRGKLTSKKTCSSKFTGTLYEKNNIKHLRDEQQSKLLMKKSILKISQDLGIKTLQPQGYRGKSRIRYQGLNQTK